MKKQTIFLIVAALVLGIVFAVAVWMSENDYRSWFGPQGDYLTSSSEQEGNVSIVRRGSGYILIQDVTIAGGDQIVTFGKAKATLKTTDERAEIVLDENSRLSVLQAEEGRVRIAADAGTVYVWTSADAGGLVGMSANNVQFDLSAGAGVSAEIYPGTQTVSVYGGTVCLLLGEEERTLREGECVVFLQDDDGVNTIEFRKVNEEVLSNFLIGRLLAENSIGNDCAALAAVIEKREAETKAALDAQKAHEEEIIAQGGTVEVITSKPVKTELPGKDTPKEVYTCTIQIRCDTILSNMDKLKAGKEKNVPKNGIILDTVKVAFADEETVYDVLKRACRYADIPIEYEWTVQYGGYYIQGINDLYEFDCGRGSGWMYKVNGWYPNYGSSNYILKDKDVIVWNYTCDLGKDLGAEQR